MSSDHLAQTVAAIARVCKAVEVRGKERHAGTVECPRCHGTLEYIYKGKGSMGPWGKCRTPDCLRWMA